MQAYKEITVWDDGNTNINHTYLLDGDKMLAYIRKGTEDEFWFKNPIRIDKRGRKFEQLKQSPFGKLIGKDVSNTREVTGSKGQTYIINLDENTCTCSGFTFRGTCKHVKELETA
jgi:hypothetical protein